ncbi:MAG: hypothetical protein WC959_03505 [Kiritimatiellales bacterium]
MKHMVLITICLLCAAAGFSEEAIVQFSWQDITTTVNASGAANTNSGYSCMWVFSEEHALLTDTLQRGTNSTIYGGVTSTWTFGATNTYIPSLRFYKASADTPGYFNLMVDPRFGEGNENTNMVTGIILWAKQDFLSGANSSAARFSTNSTLSMAFTGGSTVVNWDVRYVVKQGGVFYVSWPNCVSAPDGAFVIHPATASWTVLTPENYLLGEMVSLVDFNDVEAVGFYMRGARSGSGSNQQINFKLNSFTATAEILSDME